MARNFSDVAKRGRITGDFGKLAAWQKLFEATPEVLDAISAGGADEMIGLIKDGFRAETDPSGKPWARKKVRDGRKILSGKTSNLKGGWHYRRADKGGFVISPGVSYATYHQTGTKRMVARKMVPDGKLPPAWSKALEEVATEALKAHFTTEKADTGGSKGSGGLGLIAYKIIGIKRRLNIKALIRKLANAGEE